MWNILENSLKKKKFGKVLGVSSHQKTQSRLCTLFPMQRRDVMIFFLQQGINITKRISESYLKESQRNFLIIILDNFSKIEERMDEERIILKIEETNGLMEIT